MHLAGFQTPQFDRQLLLHVFTVYNKTGTCKFLIKVVKCLLCPGIGCVSHYFPFAGSSIKMMRFGELVSVWPWWWRLRKTTQTHTNMHTGAPKHTSSLLTHMRTHTLQCSSSSILEHASWGRVMFSCGGSSHAVRQPDCLLVFDVVTHLISCVHSGIREACPTFK